MYQFQWHRLLLAVSGVVLAGATALGQTTTDTGASVLVFPRVVVDGTWETAIQIGNSANRPAYARCYYVNGALTTPGQPPGPENPPLWVQTSFNLVLLRRQPSQWVVSRGRAIDASDASCEAAADNCDGTGIDPGRIGEVPDGFTGELVCVEVDASGAPWSGNALIGQATLTHFDSGEVVRYPAIGLPGLESNNADGSLCVGGEADAGCPGGPEYGACPNEWIVSHPSDFDDRSVDRSASRTNLTIVPCGQDLDTLVPTSIVLQLRVVNELEQTFSASTSISCWADIELGELNAIFQRDLLGSDWVQTSIRTPPSAGGIMLVQQTVRESARPPRFTAVATAPHQDGAGEESDVIVLPQEKP